MSTDTACIVLTTAGTEDEADQLASAIVEARLAACVQIQRVRSLYRWQGEVRNEPEWQLCIKTRTGRYAALEALIRERHSYETPEIVQLPITAGSADYLRWVAQETAA
ncbi:divalent-cation tolerance protein CutA [Xenophilus arseniciresistens]|uniref:Divalent-cation tolerance protein CutA n=1 Tax=Xenophilus arseniciresistens TaxID=1283306 RepID=A0AAE3N9Z9_9BURK|nr:divalent-cation tolerance protein CutA [Xenophilus arseniciresistens]MDA7417041.1 divalent-cation tolerance protein CutA [Xenophilus arseniciresistens]